MILPAGVVQYVPMHSKYAYTAFTNRNTDTVSTPVDGICIVSAVPLRGLHENFTLHEITLKAIYFYRIF